MEPRVPPDFFEGRYFGPHLQGRFPCAARRPWFWGLDFFEWQGSDAPQYGKAAKVAFCAAWESQAKGDRKGLGIAPALDDFIA
jgi:hypothetical protein